MDVYNAFLQGDVYEEIYIIASEIQTARCHEGRHDEVVIILVYVDDLLIKRTSTSLINQAKDILHQKFKVKDLGELKYFLGIEVLRSKSRILLNQNKIYAPSYFRDGAKHACAPL
ncbi:uncharacterized mitochondrial protein AtMg00810-like [Nicotiana tomentosiformis]|uniref:uncharacterized mitochondrial protein AtMg00810-like n=1 Tax=Nicotiana tomentosiformis TaxID=4098 RepID=UPI00388C5C31